MIIYFAVNTVYTLCMYVHLYSRILVLRNIIVNCFFVFIIQKPISYKLVLLTEKNCKFKQHYFRHTQLVYQKLYPPGGGETDLPPTVYRKTSFTLAHRVFSNFLLHQFCWNEKTFRRIAHIRAFTCVYTYSLSIIFYVFYIYLYIQSVH